MSDKPRIRYNVHGQRVGTIRNSAFDAGSHGRRLKNWTPTSGGPNSVLFGSLETMRNRSRDAERNNGWISRGTDSWVTNEIGTGIVPRSRASNEQFREQITALWKQWNKEADADGMTTFYGLLAMAARTRFVSGECFIRRRMRNLSDDLVVPMQLQIMEPDLCPPETNGFELQGGIEFDAIGRRRAYKMFRSHPGDIGMRTGLTTMVPADGVIHHYAPLRPGQIRGQPWTIQALLRAKDFDEYDDAERVRKKNKSAITGFIKRPEYTEDDYNYDPISGKPIHGDIGEAESTIEAGTFSQLLPGEDVEMASGDDAGQGYADYVKQQLLGKAAALGVPFELMSWDMRGISDRMFRAVLNEFHRTLEQTQWMVTIPQICDRVWAWFVDAAVASGKIDAPDYAQNRRDYLRVEWQPDAWPALHPVQDVEADKMAVRSGFMPRQEAVAKRGHDIADVDEQMQEDQERADSLGLWLDTDPRRTANSGSAHREPDPGEFDE